MGEEKKSTRKEYKKTPNKLEYTKIPCHLPIPQYLNCPFFKKVKSKGKTIQWITTYYKCRFRVGKDGRELWCFKESFRDT